MARPKKEQHEERNKLLMARVTEAERITAKQRAAAAGFDVSDLIRRACLDDEIAPANDASAVDASLISELNAIGNNVNQIARNLNSGRRERSDIDVVLAELRGVLDKVASSYGA